MGDYHKLEVWKLACELSDRIHFLVEELGPRLRPSRADQITRAADAIHENIAEGCGFNSDRQLAKYLSQALGSGDEVQDELEALKRRKMLSVENYDLLPNTKLLCQKLGAFLQTVDPTRRHRRPRRDQADRRADDSEPEP
jgi:four helix bundle protein